MISIVVNFSEKLPVLFFFLLLSVSTANLSYLLATTFSSLRFFFNFTSLQSFECGQRGFLFSHFRVLSSIPSLSFLCSSVSEALFTLSFSFLSERFFFVHASSQHETHYWFIITKMQAFFIRPDNMPRSTHKCLNIYYPSIYSTYVIFAL